MYVEWMVMMELKACSEMEETGSNTGVTGSVIGFVKRQKRIIADSGTGPRSNACELGLKLIVAHLDLFYYMHFDPM